MPQRFVSRSFCPGIHSFSIEGYVVWCVNAVARAETEKTAGIRLENIRRRPIHRREWTVVWGAWGVVGWPMVVSVDVGRGGGGWSRERGRFGIPELAWCLSLSPRGGPGRLRRRWFPFVLSFSRSLVLSFRSLRPSVRPSVCLSVCLSVRVACSVVVPLRGTTTKNSTARCAVEFFLPLLQDCCSRALVIDRSTAYIPCVVHGPTG